MTQSPNHSQLSEDSEEDSQELQHHFLKLKYEQIFQKHPKFTSEQTFYFEYCKLYIDTLNIQKKIEEAIQQIDSLRALSHNQPLKARKITSQLSNHDTSEDKRKRLRRTANQIARHYVCRVQKCQKSYGSEGSLNQHMKIKHPELMDGTF